MSDTLRILIAGHMISGEATGEGFVAFKLTEALAGMADVTLATLQSPRHTPLAKQLAKARVVTFPQPQFLLRPRQFRELVKPELWVYARHLRRFLQREAGSFDIAHQLMPAALRHASPLRGLGLPYVLGPFGGTLPTPAAFRAETESSGPWYARLRDIDRLRLRHDPRLRASISGAALVLGVAPYIRDILVRARLSPRLYADFMKLGIPDLPPDLPPRRRTAAEPLRLVHVGRGVRTKALRDVIRALGHLRDDRRFTLESAGGGPEIALCRAEAEALGIADRVTFHDRLPRAEVETLYRRADAFVFPSFREPAGAVFFEAMRWGLPVIAARAGGAEAIVDDNCGIKVEVTDPDRFPRDIAAALVRLADEPDLYSRLSEGARLRVADALWPNLATQLIAHYRAALDTPA
jgi:glycosyltransferase involved in cell wall biosynthesis